MGATVVVRDDRAANRKGLQAVGGETETCEVVHSVLRKQGWRRVSVARMALGIVTALFLGLVGLWGGTPAARAESGFLGIQVQPVDPTIRQGLAIPTSGGVIVRDVEGGGPAWSAGLRPGDVILEVQGQPLSGFDALIKKMGTTEPGQALSFRLWRQGAARTVRIDLGSWPTGWRLSDVSTAILPEFGLTVVTLSEKNRLAFGVRWGLVGVIVKAVEPGKPAALAGLKVGDTVVAAGRSVVTAPDTLETLLQAMGPAWSVLVERGNSVVLLGAKEGVPVVAGETLLVAALKDGPYVMDAARNDFWVAPTSSLPEMPAPYSPPAESREGVHPVGMTVASLSAERRARYGLRWSSRGVVVDGVDAGSRAQTGGLRAGDVIAQINQTPVTDPVQARTLMVAASGPIVLLVERPDGFQFVVLGVTTAGNQTAPVETPAPPLLKWQSGG